MKKFHIQNSWVEILYLFIVLVLLAFPYHIDFNEMDVLPYARSVYNKHWLPADWYLNLDIPYRYLFSYSIGFLAEAFGWMATIFIGRFLSYLLFAIALRELSRILNAGKLYFLFFLAWAVYIKVFRFGMGDAGEWIVGGLESKVFAYSFAMLSLAAFIKKRNNPGMVYAGLALSFHLLVGIYNIFCLLPVVLLNQAKDIKSVLKSAYLFVIMGSLGLYGIFYQLFKAAPEGYSSGWDIYVTVRVGSHTLPDFSAKTWILLLLFTVGVIFFILKSKKQEVKAMGGYAVFSVLILVIGLVIYQLPGGVPYMRYYFFRFSDVMLPQLFLLMLAAFLSEGSIGAFLVRQVRYVKPLAFILAGIFCLSGISKLIKEGTLNAGTFLERTLPDKKMAAWIRTNTDTEDVFIIDPGDFYFYINCERPSFVSWKHSPQNSKDIMEWYARLKRLNHGNDFSDLAEIRKSYKSLNEYELLMILNDYPDVHYLLVPQPTDLHLPLVYKTGKSVLYSLHDQPLEDGQSGASLIRAGLE
ncbi:MAG: hypothetical protein JW801_18305 [Bacteroidales bacterium]|nr:hypothetical protein [Bacteroidales bacterium]